MSRIDMYLLIDVQNSFARAPFNFQAYYHNIDVKQVDVPSGTGTFGILPNHVPTLAVLKPGVLTVFEDQGTKKFFGKCMKTVTMNVSIGDLPWLSFAGRQILSSAFGPHQQQWLTFSGINLPGPANH